MLYGVLGTLLVLFLLLCVIPEQHGTPMLANAGVDLQASADQPGGNMEGKEVRFGISASGTLRGHYDGFYARRSKLGA